MGSADWAKPSWIKNWTFHFFAQIFAQTVFPSGSVCENCPGDFCARIAQGGFWFFPPRAILKKYNIYIYVLFEKMPGEGRSKTPRAILAQKSPGQFSHTEPLGKKVWANILANNWKVEFSILGRPKSASGLRFSESPSKTIGGTEVLVQIRCLAAHFVAV